MIRSMTGFGKCEDTVDGYDVIVEIKSVNHRYFEFSSRISRGYGFLEEKLKSYLQSRLSRGKVDVYVSVEALKDMGAQVLVNHSLASGYVNTLRELAETYHLKDDISVSTVAQYSEIFTIHKAPENDEAVWAAVRPVAEKALNALVRMRETEGERLKADVLQRVGAILDLVGQVEERSPQTVAEYQQKLRQRLAEMLADSNIEEQRILTEAAVFADKVAVAEETVRLRSHIAQCVKMLDSEESVGRRLDFIVQEMNREANTIGSKCVDARIAHMVVDMKAEIEKIREQIQNIE